MIRVHTSQCSNAEYVDQSIMELMHCDMQQVLNDVFTRFFDAVHTEPLEVIAVCPEAGIPLGTAISKLYVKAGMPSENDVWFAVYNPTHIEEAAYVAMFALAPTHLSKAVANEYLGKKRSNGGYLCVAVPSIEYTVGRAEAAEKRLGELFDE